jgi:uncharacterized repeat protein (TIGR03803 family)
MKSILQALLFGLFWCVAVYNVRLSAQTFSTLHQFVFPAEIPYAPIAQGQDGMLYGTSSEGGNGDYGTVFKVNPDGTGFTNIYNFADGLDGANPDAGLALSGGVVYGTASGGGCRKQRHGIHAEHQRHRV